VPKGLGTLLPFLRIPMNLPSFIFTLDEIPCFFPRRHPSFEGLGILVPHSDIPGRLTGGASLPGSGSVKDDLLVFAQSGKFRLEFPEGNRALQLHLAEAAFIFISADQQESSRLQPLADLLRADTLDTHFSTLTAIQVIQAPTRTGGLWFIVLFIRLHENRSRFGMV